MRYYCQCSAECTAIVVNKRKKYTRGHSPNSRKTSFYSGQVPWNKGTKGECTSWNSGLTKYTDKRIAKMAKKSRGKEHPWTTYWNSVLKSGTTLSDSQKDKISKTLKIARSTYAPIWNKGLTKETSKVLQKLAKTMSKNTKGIPRPYSSDKQGTRRFWYKHKKFKLKMRSRWEVAFAKCLDMLKVKWLYESVTYIMDTVSYTPDFYLPKDNVFIEIKGYDTKESKEKRKLLRVRYKVKLKCFKQLDLQYLGVI